MSAPGARRLAEIRAVARSSGLAPALTALRDEVLPGLLPCGPGGHAVVPASLLAEPAELWFDGEAGVAAEAGPATAWALPGGAVSIVSFRRSGPASDAVAAGRQDWQTGLLAVRLGLSEGLRDACRRYLATRRVGESFALHQQMVKADLAAAAIRQEEAGAALPAAGELDETSLGYLHTAVTDADRLLAPLLGAAGYLRGSHGHAADASELVAGAYLPVRCAA